MANKRRPSPDFDFAASPSGRALQLLKALSVAGMVAVHAFFWAATHRGRLQATEASPLFQFVQENMILGILPLLLPFTAGCALRLRWSRRDGGLVPVQLREAFLQAAGLAIAGYAMNVLAAGWYPVWSWNVLQLVALSLLLIALLDRIGSSGAVAAAAVAVLISSDWLHTHIAYYTGPGWLKVLLGDPAYYHTWPVVPWFALIAFGWLVAEGLLRFRDANWFRGGLATLGVVAAVYAASYGRLLPPFDPAKLIGPRIFIAPSAAVIGVIGWAALLTVALSWIAPYVRAGRYGIIRCFSGGILWIYVIHTTVGSRFYEAAIKPLDRVTLLADPTSPASMALLAGYPIALLAISWGVGFLVLRFLHEKRFHLRIRRQNSAAAQGPVPRTWAPSCS